MSLPDALPQCDPRRSISPTSIALDAPAVALAFVDVDGAGGRELVAVDAAGNLEIFTPELQEWATSTLPQAVTRIFATDLGGDSFGDLLAVSTAGSGVLALFGDGLGGFTIAEEIATGGANGPAVTGDWNLDGIEDIAVVVDVDGSVSILVFAGEPGGLGSSTSIQLDAPATALAATVHDGDDGLLVALDDQSLLRFDSAGDGTFELGASDTTSTAIVGLAPYVNLSNDSPEIAGLGVDGSDAVLELRRAWLGLKWQWPLPQLGAPRGIAAFQNPWSGADVVVAFGDTPVILIIASLGSPVPCFVTADAGPGVTLGPRFTFPFVSTEQPALVRLDARFRE